ncbi:hypothetical protein [Actinomyces sp. MRS3W]|uniref:hypothetical protein n=1 Tax=Actinomyces sp. MRS3W TaxID=2800796 RepID=UPI0028FD78B0|nr:hypothetical protein [Actinomyces sp. MRS3W]MDU0347358.1 hypothetical protein [Actinomyces sp. MRS3W]
MSSFLLSLAANKVAVGTGMVPATVPTGWTGAAATACQTSLDDAVILLSGLESLLIDAQDAVAALENAESQAVAEP